MLYTFECYIKCALESAGVQRYHPIAPHWTVFFGAKGVVIELERCAFCP